MFRLIHTRSVRCDLLHSRDVTAQYICTKFAIILFKKRRIFIVFFKDKNDPKFFAEEQRKVETFRATFCPVLELWKCGVVQSHWVKCKIICIEVKLAVFTVAWTGTRMFSYLHCFDTVRRRVCHC